MMGRGVTPPTRTAVQQSGPGEAPLNAEWDQPRDGGSSSPAVGVARPVSTFGPQVVDTASHSVAADGRRTC
jgi:hypothetical protein